MIVATVETTPGMVNTGASYSFPNVAPGTYTVQLDTTDPDIPGTLTLGTPAMVTGIVVGVTESVGGIDFGFDANACSSDNGVLINNN